MNYSVFFNSIRFSLGSLTQDNVDGFNAVLAEAEIRGTPRNQLAYILATAWWETGKTMQPIREAFYISKTFSVAEAWRKKNLRYYPYYGRGFVQLTWDYNYEKAGKKLGKDFLNHPDDVMELSNAIKILFDGMESGWFTGKDLNDYIDTVDEPDNLDLQEFINARRIINGTDKATTIGNLALQFEHALTSSDYPNTPIIIPKQPDITDTVTAPAPQPNPIPVQIKLGFWQQLLNFLKGIFHA